MTGGHSSHLPLLRTSAIVCELPLRGRGAEIPQGLWQQACHRQA
jgi:hypothetical protein